MKTIVSIFGTRPEAIKMAPVVKALESAPDFESKVIVTGQHRDILDQVLELFEITPVEDLEIMRDSQTLFDISCHALRGLEEALAKHKADAVLVQGDTTTAFIAGLAAFYYKIPVGHVEAGLRTGNVYDPFPEEINRRLLTQLSQWHFAPTSESKQHVLNSGIPESQVYVTGNTVCDALQGIAKALPEGIPKGLLRCPARTPVAVDDLWKEQGVKRWILVESHRRENLGAPQERICQALLSIVERYPDIGIVFSVHPNPKVREVVVPALGSHPRIALIEPVDYPTLIQLVRESYFILTDSGGIQEEAPSLGVPVGVLRETTERPEGVDCGVAKLLGTSVEKINNFVDELLGQPEHYKAMCQIANPYGDGLSSERILQAMRSSWGDGERPKDFSSR